MDRELKSDNDISSDDDSFCPALPDYLKNKSSKKDTQDTLSTKRDLLINKSKDKCLLEKKDIQNEEADLYCPALPPHLISKETNDTISKLKCNRLVGPLLPENYEAKNFDSAEYHDKALSIESDDTDEENIIGPLPNSNNEDSRFKASEIALREQMLKKDKDIKKQMRESWMLELPDDRPNFKALGLGSRQFRKTNPIEKGDRSVWTDTPSDKERKAKLQKTEDIPEEFESIVNKKRDEQLDEMVKKYTEKKRNTPLIDIHHKKRTRNNETNSNSRKPFSREEDLNINKFDEAQKQTILKKARHLNDRFSAGKRKFL